MTDTSTQLRFEPPGPGSWEQDAVHFPRPMTRYFQETHPAGVQAGHQRLRALLRDAHRRPRRWATCKASATTRCCRLPKPRSPNASSAPNRSSRRSSGANSFATGTRSASRLPSPRTGSCRRRSGRALRRRTGRLSDALPRPPRGDDRPAHALHRRCRAADRRLPRARRRLDRPAAVGTARPDARLGRGVRGRLRRDGAPEERASPATPAAREVLASDGDPAQVLASLRCARGRGRRGGLRLPRPGRQPSRRRLRHRRAHGARTAGRAAARHPHRRLRRSRSPPRTSRPAPPRSAPRFPRRTRPSSTNCSARRASPTACATSVASTATSGPRA